MNELIPSIRNKVLQLEEWMRQAIKSGAPIPEWTTNHYFHGGMYAREMFHPPGMTVVGKVHKKESFFLVTQGTVQIALDDGPAEFSAPAILQTKVGTKRVVYSRDGATYVTVHKTKAKTVERAEREIVERDKLAIYDALNKPKLKELK